MPHDGLRFGQRSKGKLSKEGKEIPRTEPTTVATSVQINSEIGEKKEIKTQKGAKKMQNVKKEEPTPENNDVKNDSKE